MLSFCTTQKRKTILKDIDFDGSGFYPEIHSNKNESLKSEKTSKYGWC